MDYDKDFYGWTQQTAEALKLRKLDEVDYEHLIEEVEDMGKSCERELINRLRILIAHLLKWQFQPSHRAWDISGKSWTLTIKEQRECIHDLLEDNPSLKSKLQSSIKKAYSSGVKKAARETSLEVGDFPNECPYTFEQIINDQFFPV